jgi:hypothetical protein
MFYNLLEMPRKRRTELSGKLLEALEVIKAWKRANDGNSPSFREIGREAGMSSTAHVRYTLEHLEWMNLIEVRGQRNIVIVGSKGWQD